MATAFDAARRRLFADRNIGADATYAPPGGGPAACRVVKRHGDQVVALGESRPIGQATFVDVLAADLTPVRGGAFTIDGEIYTIVGDPIRSDVDRAIWTCTVR